MRTREEQIEHFKTLTIEGNAVPYTEELARVLALPMRDWEKRMEDTQLHLRMTTAYRQPHGTQVLFPIQAAAIAEAHDYRGLLGPIGVGSGKTLITFLIPLVLAVARPLLLVPASLREKTYRDFAKLRTHWIGHPSLRVEGYEALSAVSGHNILNNYQPDMLLLDECHEVKNLESARARRIKRYMEDSPNTIVIALSGSMTKRSILDFWHLAYWALRQNVPLPRSKREVEAWASVIDETKDVSFGRVQKRRPGALTLLCEDLDEDDFIEPVNDVFSFASENTKKEKVRLGFQKRLRSTPGVVCSGAESLPCSLVIEKLDWPLGPNSKEKIEKLKSTGYTPHGDLLSESAAVWQMTLEMACGFYYRCDPPAPEDWLTARRSWNAAVRQILDKHLVGLDSVLQIERALTYGHYVDSVASTAYRDWVAIRDTFEPNVVAEWIDDTIVNRCAEWMNTTRGIVWVKFKAMGERLSQISGHAFCSEQGTDPSGKMLEDFEGNPVIASIDANSTGRNLQAWSRGLVTTPMSSGLDWEQLLGRKHRNGQREDTVTYSWVCSLAEHEDAFKQAVADARYASTTVGPSRQRLLYADHVNFSKD